MKISNTILSTFKLSKQLHTTAVGKIYPEMRLEEDVIFKSNGNKGLIVLNRPKSLNVLNLYMIKSIFSKLKEWEKDKLMVIIKGTGDKAFCAGGDVKDIIEAGVQGEHSSHDLFRRAFMLSHLIASYRIPYISFLNGIVMGGGVGVSIYGTYRVATEKTIFSMPETAIGYCPDIGSSYFFPRLLGKVGTYLSLTGGCLKGSDIVKIGIATHYCESDKLDELEESLIACRSKEEISLILDRFNKKDNTQFTLTPILSKINKCFSASTVEEIIEALEEDGSDWAKETIAILLKKSPTSLKVAHKALNFGSKMNLYDCLRMEYRLAIRFLENKDIYEGVRAMLIDKDSKPSWTPKTLEDVTDMTVNSYFKPLPSYYEFQHKL